MKSPDPKRALLVTVFFLLLSLVSAAQKSRFIYIQSEGNHPFSVKLGGKLFASSEAGYLILSRLDAGNYELFFGFPKNEWPVQKVTCAVKEENAGYQLRYFGSKGWGLVNLQTAAILFMQPEGRPAPDALTEPVSDSFALVLASVVGDNSILQRQQPAVKDSIARPSSANLTTTVPTEKPSVTKKSDIVKEAALRKIDEEKQADGLRIRYIDGKGETADTVLVLIPFSASKIVKADSLSLQKPGPQPIATQTREETPRFIGMKVPDSHVSADSMSGATDTLPGAVVKKVTPRPPCKQVATEKDFLNLRKQMSAAESDSGKVTAALKWFRSTCYSTEQIRNLGSLFLTDEGKYKLYVAAYPFVADLDLFGTLGSELKDAYYISRFRAMLTR